MAIFEVFYQPGKLFASLAERKGVWIMPLILGLLFLVATTAALVHFVGLETIMRQQLEGTRLTPEQMQIAMNRATAPSQVYVTYVGTVVTGLLSYLLIAGLLTVFALMGSKQPEFSANFSMVVVAFLPYRLLICLMSVLVLVAAPDRTTLEAANLLATNAGAFMNKETISKALYTLLSQLDMITFAQIGFLSFGFSRVNRTGLSFGLFAVVSLWIVYVFIRVALSLVF